MPARLIKTEPRSDEWYHIKSCTIGSSEAAALFGLSSYTTRFELFVSKKNGIQDKFDSDNMFWGRKLERSIAEGICEKRGWELIEPEGVYLHETIDGMSATPDFFVKTDKGKEILEVKNVDVFRYMDEWGKEPPIEYVIQLQEQFSCTNIESGYIGALVGGGDYEIFPYDANQMAINKIEKAVVQFWQDIRDNKQPSIIDRDLSFIKKLHPRREEIDLTGDNMMPGLCAELQKATTNRLAMEKIEHRLKAEIINKIKGADLATCQGYIVEYPEFKRHNKEQNESISTYRQLRIKEI